MRVRLLRPLWGFFVFIKENGIAIIGGNLMKHKLLIAAAATALMAAPSFASAQDDAGWYLKGAAGYGIGTDIDISEGIVGDAEAEGNVAGNVGVGYDFGENWRVELDGTTNFNDFGAVAQAPASFAKLRQDTLMLNAIYDFSDFDRWEPYVGAGLGLVRTDASVVAHDFPDSAPAGSAQRIVNPVCVGQRNQFDAFSCNFDGEETKLGFQLLAGLGYEITDNLTWDTSYRYLQSGDVEIDGEFINSATGAATSSQIDIDNVGGHQLLTGFRYRFGDSAPAFVPEPPAPTPDFQCWDGSFVFNSGQCPPERIVEAAPEPTVVCWDGTLVFDAAQCPIEPAPAPAPIPQVQCPDGSFTSDINFCPRQGDATIDSLCGEQYRQEIIYYEFDKGASAETRNTIGRILDAGQFCDVSNIRVVGHTDTSGAASYNLALSKRRATDALNELVRQGVDRSVITAEGKGETEPFVQTGDGVKEQLNRRTEVLITLGSIGAVVN